MRQTLGFGWFVGVADETLSFLAGIDLDEYYLNPDSCVRAIRLGRARIGDLFSDDVRPPGVSCPPLSYGHIACLGAKVLFPHNSEPSVRPVFDSIQDAIDALSRKRKFEENDLFKHYDGMYRRLREEFPEENVKFMGFGHEGPITSAVLLRGKDFCVDLYRHPDDVKRFLELVTDSIVDFVRFTRRINSEPEDTSQSFGLADDFSSLIHPEMWGEFVVPYWDRYYSQLTSGARTLHCENLDPRHLKYLEQVGISYYDPSISPRLRPSIIKDRTTIPFTWRLASFELLRMSVDEVRDWVRSSAEEGATHVHFYVEWTTCTGDNPSKVSAFISAAKERASTVA